MWFLVESATLVVKDAQHHFNSCDVLLSVPLFALFDHIVIKLGTLAKYTKIDDIAKKIINYIKNDFTMGFST